MSPLVVNNRDPEKVDVGLPPFGNYPPADYAPKGAHNEVVYFTTPLGDEIDFTTTTTWGQEQWKSGLNARFTPPVQHYSDTVPAQHGARYRGSRYLPNLLPLLITFEAPNFTALRTRLRELTRRLSIINGLGRLTVRTGDGVERYVNCVFESGFETDPATVGDSDVAAAVTINFRAFDPFWYDVEPIKKPITSTTAPGTFFPGPPWHLGASTIFASFTEENEGDIEAWPVWTISGPGDALKIRNDTYGLWSSLDIELRANEQIIIDTRQGIKAVYGSTSSNLFPEFDGSLWSLQPGSNRIVVEMLTTTSNTLIHLDYQPRYLGV